MSDTMLLGVLRMPYGMAMGSKLSQLQYHSRGQEAADRIEQLGRELAAEKALADQGAERVSRWIGFDDGDGGDAAFLAAYRKARGL